MQHIKKSKSLEIQILSSFLYSTYLPFNPPFLFEPRPAQSLLWFHKIPKQIVFVTSPKHILCPVLWLKETQHLRSFLGCPTIWFAILCHLSKFKWIIPNLTVFPDLSILDLSLLLIQVSLFIIMKLLLWCKAATALKQCRTIFREEGLGLLLGMRERKEVLEKWVREIDICKNN